MRKLFIVSSLVIAAMSSFSAMADYVAVFKEGFSKCESTTPGGGYYSESLYFDGQTMADNKGWTIQDVYEAERSVKFNAKTKTGWLVTPAVKFSKDVAPVVKVLFRCQVWTGDHPDIHVEIEGNAASRQTLNLDASKNITDRSLDACELTFTNVPTGAKFRFSADKRTSADLHRFFLSDIVVLEEVATPAPSLHSSCYYHKFNNLMAGDDSETRIIRITGNALGASITIDDSALANFKITKGADWNDKTGGTLNAKFVAANAGQKLEALKVSSGDITESILLSGHAKVWAPVAVAAKNITATSFEASWEPVAGMDEMHLKVYSKEEGPMTATNLMFTKYIEGTSNNRAIEIFNGTGAAVNLKGWKLRMEANLSGGIVAGEYALPDKALANGECFTICNAQFAALRDISSATIGFQDGGYSNIMTFTGDDAIGLFDPENNLIDLLGYESVDCNDKVNGNWGMDVTYYRKSTSYAPHPKFYVQEWDKYEKDYSANWGKHALAASGPVRKYVADITVDGKATSALISGLTEGKEYFYVVEGISNKLHTPYSNEISVTAGNAGIDDVTIDPNAPVEYFDLQGIRVSNPQSGRIYILRQGAKVVKSLVK